MDKVLLNHKRENRLNDIYTKPKDDSRIRHNRRFSLQHQPSRHSSLSSRSSQISFKEHNRMISSRQRTTRTNSYLEKKKIFKENERMFNRLHEIINVSQPCP
jgi:hypothetical protein